ncbi:MAG: RnfABCDGE type electron transport complex subunit D [Solobacterium sp.]|nr:RnfABCDGE type electron transport complex subunit D [Solobacterium sp.]
MKFTFKPSPNYHTKQTTIGIMWDLTVCLLSILLFAAVYYGMTFGAAYGLRVIIMAVCAVAAAVASEAVFFKATGVKDIATEVKHSFSWVTALIIVLITRLDVSYYAIIVATVISIIVGKLVFGGFGQNIFNPAAIGEAIIMNYFGAAKAAKVTADVFTGATPISTFASSGWIMSGSALGDLVDKAGGLTTMFLGSYPSVVGGSCALLIILCGIFMVWRKDIDWHLTVTYLLSIFVISLVVGLFHGGAFEFAFLNLITGGTLFGAVFMMTDPVTTPFTIPGRMIFAFGCACFTLLIRWKANLPDGVLYSILLMNMVSPAIDKFVNGNQIKEADKIRNKVIICGAIFCLIPMLVGALTKVETKAAEPAPAPAPAAAVSANDYSANNASCTAEGGGVYACKADGYAAQNEGGAANEAKITIADGKVVSVEVTTVSDTPGISDSAVSADALKAYEGSATEDVTTGATASFTEGSIKAMIAKALAMDAE